jgi:methionine-rich copper-binding protein CopC
MRVGLKALGLGSYKVHWHAASADTHATDGNFSFNLRSP